MGIARFKSILDSQPLLYTKSFTIYKKECIDIQKHMDKRLRDLKKNTKGLGEKGNGLID